MLPTGRYAYGLRSARERAVDAAGGRCTCCGDSRRCYLTVVMSGVWKESIRAYSMVTRDNSKVWCYNCLMAKTAESICQHLEK